MKRIQTKITLTFLILAVVIIAAVGLISSFEIESLFKERLVSDLEQRANAVHFFLAADSLSGPRARSAAVKKLAVVWGTQVTLIADDGKVVANSDVPFDKLSHSVSDLQRPEIQQATTETAGIDIRPSEEGGKEFLYVAKQYRDSLPSPTLRDVRFIRVSEHIDGMKRDVSAIRWNIFWAGMITLTMIIGASIFISRRISRPMVTIAEDVEKIRLGDLERHIESTSNDEIGKVAQAVNELVDKLKADIVELKKLQRARSEFLGNVSHELRTPIFTLQGYLETLLNGAIDDPSVNRLFIEKASSHAARLNTLLNDLIDISRIESGEMKMSFRYFHINEFLETVTNDFHQPAVQRHIGLRVDLATDPELEVLGDKERLREVMSNLIDNAIKYNKESGDVIVSAKANDGKVVIEVSDSGSGIAEEHLSRIFERFYRVDKDRSREVGGTGLGLAIVKHIVEAHGGKVEVESTLGKGTTFRFDLKK
ncbi:MAG TPA: ATP-binding protein [Bacteroidota bacterium]|nr:ATP-binding protein [Bacteroidota bacterium]